MQQAPSRPRAVLWILMLASAASMMATDLYAPSLPFLPHLLDTYPETAQLTLSLNLLAYAIGTLAHGPLSECYGRRPVLLWGMAAFTATSLLCALAGSIEQLILFRVLQGLAAAVEGVVVLAIIRDLFAGAEQVRAMAWYGMATSLPPALAPVLGSFIFLWFGWRMNFHFLAAFAFVTTLLIARTVPESRQGERRRLQFTAVLRDYRELACNWNYLRRTLIAGAAVAYLYVFATGGPFVVVEYFRMPTQYFGYLQCLLVVAFVAGSFTAGRLANRVGPARLLSSGIGLALAGTAVFALLVLSGADTPFLLTTTLTFIALALGPIFATVPTLAMDATPVNTGSAAACLVAMEMALGSLGALLVGTIYDGTALPLAVTFCFLSLAMIIASIRGKTGAAEEYQ